MQTNVLETLAAAVGEVIWTLPDTQVRAAEPALRALLAAGGWKVSGVLQEIPDETLAVAVQKEFLRKDAFEEWLVNRYEKALLRWFYSRTGNWENAQDLTQELYLKLLRKDPAPAYDPNHLFSPWLWTVVRNMQISDWRRQQKHVSLGSLALPASDPAPQEEAAARELESRAEAVILELPGPQQRVLRAAMNGASADDIARQVGLPKQQIFQLLFKARRFVERALGLDPGGRARRTEAFPTPRVPLEDSSR
jgi:RNA polymerase sigma-70 factor (ECF subfamily)